MEEFHELSLSELEQLHSFILKDIFDFIFSTDSNPPVQTPPRPKVLCEDL